MMFRSLMIALATLAFAVPLSAAKANVLISVDESAQRMTVTVDGERRWTWPVSTGRSGFATPTGSFTTFRMEEDHYSKEWDEAPMPHSIFFTKLGHAIHGTMDRRRLGSAASHGCVRLSTSNAATLYALVKQKGLANTQVVVTARRPANALVARRTLRPVPEQPESKMGPTPLQATFEQNNTVFGFTQPERSD
jgi:L,D-transpeptidase catalytic domain